MSVAAPHLLIASSGSFLVTPNVGIMIWTLVVFAISLFILNKAVFPRIGAALDARQHAIEESIDAAERTRHDQLLSEYRERLQEARQQAEEILQRAQKTAQAYEQRSREEADAKHQDALEKTKRDIEAETRRAIAEIRREVADLTVIATEKLTRKVLNEDDQRRLVQDAISELDFSALSGASGSS